MAYVSQDRKKAIHAKLKPVLKRWGVKGSLAVRHHSTLILTLSSGRLNPLEDRVEANWRDDPRFAFPNLHIDVNTYWIDHHFQGPTRIFLKEVMAILNDGNHDNSDIQTDYFDVGWYVNVQFGKWDKPYVIDT
jgi:hypothetical protein